MIARLLIGPLEKRVEEIRLHLKGVNTNHPDVLYFKAEEKLGIAEARKIKNHFSLKPYSAKGRAVILEDASVMTIEAQNALLKTLEEPPSSAILILAAPSDSKFLPTILSRCQIIRLQAIRLQAQGSSQKKTEDIEKLLSSNIEERFEYIEKCKEREEFLHALVSYFRDKNVLKFKSFIEELLQAEAWAEANVNIRAILEYLMLVMPRI